MDEWAPRIDSMNHNEAVKEMAAERYLLEELTPEARDAFEEHLFDCAECALDVRAGSAFMDEAKIQLPEIAAGLAVLHETAKSKEKRNRWFSWWRPAFVVPAFAALLMVVGYQNLVTFPALHSSANEPRIVPIAPLYGATRGETHITITADRIHGIALPVDLPIEPGTRAYVSYSFDLNDPQGELAWTGTIASPAQQPGADLQLSIVLPGRTLNSGTYSMAVSGVGADGSRTAVERYVFDVVLPQ